MEAIQVVFEELRKKGTKGLSHYLTVIYSQTCFHRRVFSPSSGNLEWLDKNKSRCLVMWRRPEEWGKLIYQWVSHTLYCLSCFVHVCAADRG